MLRHLSCLAPLGSTRKPIGLNSVPPPLNP
ncbi:hypothetical protein Gohar_006124, partial [Gossypium harknessii]|nr:hypothetical protein [Gossypium harknessii]